MVGFNWELTRYFSLTNYKFWIHMRLRPTETFTSTLGTCQRTTGTTVTPGTRMRKAKKKKTTTLTRDFRFRCQLTSILLSLWSGVRRKWPTRPGRVLGSQTTGNVDQTNIFARTNATFVFQEILFAMESLTASMAQMKLNVTGRNGVGFPPFFKCNKCILKAGPTTT